MNGNSKSAEELHDDAMEELLARNAAIAREKEKNEDRLNRLVKAGVDSNVAIKVLDDDKYQAVFALTSELNALNGKRTAALQAYKKQKAGATEEYSKSIWLLPIICIAITGTISYFLFNWWIDKNYTWWIGTIAFVVSAAFLLWDIGCVYAATYKNHEEIVEKAKRQCDLIAGHIEMLDKKRKVLNEIINEIKSE